MRPCDWWLSFIERVTCEKMGHAQRRLEMRVEYNRWLLVLDCSKGEIWSRLFARDAEMVVFAIVENLTALNRISVACQGLDLTNHGLSINGIASSIRSEVVITSNGAE